MRRGQLQTLEPILIVIVLSVLFGVGLLFFVKLQAHDPMKAVTSEREATALLKKITTLPELSCPTSETVQTYCLDLVKAQMFSEMLGNAGNASFYFPLFGRSSVTLEWYDLSYGDEAIVEQLELYNALLEGADVAMSTTYFTVYDPVADQRYFASIMVRRQT